MHARRCPVVRTGLSLLLIAQLTGCKSTSEDEQKRHQSLGGKVQRYSARYPAYAAVLAAELARSKEAFDKAKKEAKGEQQVEQMKAANNIVSSRTSEIERYESSSDELKRLLRHSGIRRQPRQQVEHILREAERALDHAQSIIQRPVQTAAEMSASLSSARSRLQVAARPLRQIKSRLDRQRRDQRKAERAARKEAKRKRKAGQK